jgi:hypothetical protein
LGKDCFHVKRAIGVLGESNGNLQSGELLGGGHAIVLALKKLIECVYKQVLCQKNFEILGCSISKSRATNKKLNAMISAK